jgi:rod shape-determining protein MreC
MAWYGRRRSGEPRVGARAIVVGLGLSMIGVLAIQSGQIVRGGIDASRRSMDQTTANLARFSSSISSWQIGFGSSKESQDKINTLQQQLAEMQRDRQRWKDLAETMTVRMHRYETLLNLVGETQGATVMARVVAEEKGPFTATRIANAGAANGVREGYAAVNPENGLVGRVIRVGEYTSRILLVSDGASKIPVIGSQSGDRALLIGDGGSGAVLAEPETPDKIVEGEIWRTSGDDGKMPLGIPVGKAHKVKEGWKIELSSSESPVDFVQLVPPPDFAKPEDAPPLGKGLPQPNSDRSLMSSSVPLAAAVNPASPPPPASRPAAPAQRPAPKPAAPPGQPAAPPAGQGATQGAGQ